MRFSFLFDTFRLRFLHTARKGEGEGREKLFARCSHRKCHLKDNKVASTVSLACVSFALFKVKLKFKLLYKCLRCCLCDLPQK